MLQALRRVSFRHLAEHKLRTTFTVGGIALGVAAMVGIRLLHESVSRSFERTVERIAGKAVLQITNGWVGVPEELLEEVRQVPGVGAAAASVQWYVATPGLKPGEGLYVFGIDLLADQELRDYEYTESEGSVDDPLVFLAQPDSVAVTNAFLERNGLKLGDPVEVRTPQGLSRLTIRAALDIHTGPAVLFGGRLAVMDVFAAQRLFGLDRRFSQIDVGLAEGASLGAMEHAVEKVVGGRGAVERPRARGEALERLLASNRFSLTLGALLALVVGVYVIFNTMMIAVAERRREIGILRSLGMRRAEVLRLVAAESLALGALGCAAGVVLGLWLAQAMAASFATSVSVLYMPVETPLVRLHLEPVLWGVALGLLSSFLAALAPAREAVRVHPLEALQPSAAERSGKDIYARAAVVGFCVLALGITLWSARDALGLGPNKAGSLVTLGLLVGVSLVVPAIVRAAAAWLEPWLGGLFGPLGMLASRNLVGHIGRVAVTCSAFLVSLAGAIAMATLISSLYGTLTVWFDSLFSTIDLVISSGGDPFSYDSTPLPASLADEISTLPQVKHVDVIRYVKLSYEGSLVTLVATDTRLLRDGVRNLILIDGERTTTLEALARGEAVVVNEAFVRKFGRGRGDRISLLTAAGEAELPIAGVCFDFDDVGTITLDRALYRRLWRDDSVNLLEPILARGADRDAVADVIRRRWGERHALFIATIDQYRKQSEAILEQSLSFAYPCIAMSIAIALLGIVNALLASVLDRVREIGILRAIGATRRQVALSVVIESAMIGLLGGALAVLTGSLLGVYELEILIRGMFAMTVFYRYPTLAVVFAFAAAIVLSAAAGALPGRAAARLRITKALEYE